MRNGTHGESGILPMATQLAPGRMSAGVLIAASVASGVAHLGTSTMPFQVGALMDGFHISAAAAGSFTFFEIGALAIAMLIISPIIDRFLPSVVAVTGVALCIVADVSIYFVPPVFPLLCLLGIIAGSGYGLVFAAMISGVAACANTDRVYALANGGALVLIVTLMLALPLASREFGSLGPFLGMAIILAVTAPAFLGFRKGAAIVHAKKVPLFRQPGVPSLLVLWTAFSLGAGGVWSFAERIGHDLHISPQTIGVTLSASTFFGITGTLVAAITAGRMPRSAALLVGLIGTGAACLMLGSASGLTSYALGVLLYWIFFMFLYSYLLGTAASIDPSGRVGTAGGGFDRLGFALGAPICGLLADHFSFTAIGILGAVTCIGFIPFCLPPLVRSFSAR